ncbi:hypothetical protein HW555_008743 [Spodoptera exigua]|uniref:Uncharacterized protein n=1 Tax=Spodoptera exigua TaxID=7107 RepID=A0A835GED6_SPOEX|nr:hypothetical protein HW555_008743 [Spodoptera exigua]
MNEKQSATQDATDKFENIHALRPRRQVSDTVEIVYIDAADLDPSKVNLENKETTRLQPVNDVNNLQSMYKFQSASDSKLELVTQNSNFAVYKLKDGDEKTPQASDNQYFHLLLQTMVEEFMMTDRQDNHQMIDHIGMNRRRIVVDLLTDLMADHLHITDRLIALMVDHHTMAVLLAVLMVDHRTTVAHRTGLIIGLHTTVDRQTDLIGRPPPHHGGPPPYNDPWSNHPRPPPPPDDGGQPNEKENENYQNNYTTSTTTTTTVAPDDDDQYQIDVRFADDEKIPADETIKKVRNPKRGAVTTQPILSRLFQAAAVTPAE